MENKTLISFGDNSLGSGGIFLRLQRPSQHDEGAAFAALIKDSLSAKQ